MWLPGRSHLMRDSVVLILNINTFKYEENPESFLKFKPPNLSHIKMIHFQYNPSITEMTTSYFNSVYTHLFMR